MLALCLVFMSFFVIFSLHTAEHSMFIIAIVSLLLAVCFLLTGIIIYG